MEGHLELCAGRTDAVDRCNGCVVRRISLCSHMGDRGIERLREISRTRHVARDTVLFKQDDPPEHVFIITEGVVKIFRWLSDGRRQVTGFLGPGDILGSVRRAGDLHCTAETLTEVQLCSFRRSEFENLLKTYPEFCFALLSAATDEIEAQHEQIILLARRRANQRLSAFLLAVGLRWQISENGHTAVPLPMARSDIADYLGLTVESVSRSFHKLKEQGYISLPKPSLVVLKNIPALYELSGFDEFPESRVAIGL